jgi:copper chaperone CopZ
MKTIVILSFILFPFIIYSQEAKPKKVEKTIHVEGVCNMCKERIEKAAYVKGVKYAEWDKEKKELNLVYSPQKTDITKIQKSIAEAGHKTKDVPANKEAYDKLPACCKYDDGVKTH